MPVIYCQPYQILYLFPTGDFYPATDGKPARASIFAASTGNPFRSYFKFSAPDVPTAHIFAASTGNPFREYFKINSSITTNIVSGVTASGRL